MEEKIRMKKIKCIIVDECHYLKNPQTGRYKSIAPIVKASKRSIMITGTPALSRPNELFSQLDVIIAPKMDWYSKFDFSKRYCAAIDTIFGLKDSGASNLSELNFLLQRTVMIRRLKDDVLKDLPDKMRHQVYIEVKEKDQKMIKEGMNKISENDQKSITTNPFEREHFLFEKNKDWLKLYQETGRVKIPAVKEYLSKMLETEEKFIVFGHHLEVLDEIESHIKKEKVDYIRIDGSTPGEKRHKFATKFQTDPKCLVAILSLQAAGVGLTLTPCRNVIFAEITWTPGALVQAEDRVHRIGQKNSVTVKYLLGKGTLDEVLWNMVVKKLDIVGHSLDGNTEKSSSFKQNQTNFETKLNQEINVYDLDDDFIDDSEILDQIEEQFEKKEKLKIEKLEKEIKEKKEKVKSHQIFDFLYTKGGELPFNIVNDSNEKKKEKKIEKEKKILDDEKVVKREVKEIKEEKKKEKDFKKIPTLKTPLKKDSEQEVKFEIKEEKKEKKEEKDEKKDKKSLDDLLSQATFKGESPLRRSITTLPRMRKFESPSSEKRSISKSVTESVFGIKRQISFDEQDSPPKKKQTISLGRSEFDENHEILDVSIENIDSQEAEKDDELFNY